MRIVLVGGGTGGHFYPLIAIAEELRAQATEREPADLLYFGPEPYNQDSLTKLDITYVRCPAGKQRRYKSVLNFFDTFKVLWGIFIAFQKLFWHYPDVVMSKGGYTSVPVVLAAALLRIPIVIHESDAVPGRANSLAARFARYIAISYDDAARFFPEKKTALTGIPIRRSFFAASPDPFSVLKIPSEKPVIFVTGGSTGAERVNTLILDTLDELLPQYTIIHQAGEKNAVAVKQTALARNLPSEYLNRYFVLGHMPAHYMTAALDAATIIIARAGSTTIFEIALKGKPSIIIPIPEDISHDQRTNAYAYARSGAASVIEERNLTDGLLFAEITRILSNPNEISAMQTAARNFTTPNAAVTLATTLKNIALEH